MRKLWEFISFIGVDKEKAHELREIVLINRIVLISILLVACFLPIEIILNGFEIVPIEIACGLAFSIIFLFNYKKLFTLSKYTVILYAVLMVSLMTFMVGGGSGSEYVLLCIIITPMLLFNNAWHTALMVLFVIASFYFVKHYSTTVEPFIYVDAEVKKDVQPYMMGMGIVILIVQVYYFKSLNISYQDKLYSTGKLLSEKNKEILDSITYAKRIQTAILPPNKLIEESFSESFVLYKPKDIVAGDFYWLEKRGDTIFMAVADCTGHGVPGALVSVICHNGLNRSVNEFGLTKPGEVLDKTRELIISEFEKSEEDVKDGMDISLLSVNKRSGKVLWAGANNPLWIFRKETNTIEEIKGNKQPVGKHASQINFDTHELTLNKEDRLYLITDGFQDQFGGPDGKKLKAVNLKNYLISSATNPVAQQRSYLNDAFMLWKGHLEQVDDVCVIGIRI